MGAILQQAGVVIAARGGEVTLQFGNVGFNLEFDAALNLSVAMRAQARVAKRMTGDARKYFFVTGSLTNATPDSVKASRFRSRARAFDLLRAAQISVDSSVGMVNVKVRNATIGLPFLAAIRIAGWIRMRAVEARNNVGESSRFLGTLDISQYEARASL